MHRTLRNLQRPVPVVAVFYMKRTLIMFRTPICSSRFLSSLSFFKLLWNRRLQKKTPKKTPKKTARSGKVRVKTEVQRRSRRSGANKKGFYSETNLAARAWSSGTGTSRDPYVL